MSDMRKSDAPGEWGRIAIVLCGGGLPAALYEVGALAALDDLVGLPSFALRCRTFVGVSAGATVAALLANGDSPHALFAHLSSQGPNPHLEISGLLAHQTGGGVMRSLFALAGCLGRAFRYCLRSRIRPTLGNVLAVAKELLPPGLASLEPWESKLAALLSCGGRQNSFRSLSRELIIPAYDLDRGDRVVFGAGGDEDVPISLAIAASAAFPTLFQPVRVRDRDLIDGGIGRVAHVDLALGRGAALVVIVNPIVPVLNDRHRVCIPSLDGMCSGLREKGLFYITDQVRRINMREKLELGLQCLQRDNPGLEIILIEPRRDEAMLFMQSLLSVRAKTETMRYGYLSAAAVLREQFPKIEMVLRRHGFSPDLERLVPPEVRETTRSATRAASMAGSDDAAP